MDIDHICTNPFYLSIIGTLNCYFITILKFQKYLRWYDMYQVPTYRWSIII